MIIRPACRKEYVALPNSLFNDRRLSADTRAMIAVLLSKPRGWELRPVALGKLLSRHGERTVGWTRLRRMFAEATAAGYMARSHKQLHKEDGTWGKYDYFVGMPEDVLRAVQKAGVAIAPQSRNPHEGLPHAQNDFTNHKEQTSQKTESINSNPPPALLPLLGTAPKRHSREPGKRDPRSPLAGQEVVQHQLALRLGLGDAGLGWLILGKLPPARRDALTAMQRSDHLNDDEVMAVRANYVIADAAAKGAAP